MYYLNVIVAYDSLAGSSSSQKKAKQNQGFTNSEIYLIGKPKVKVIL